MHSVCVPFHIIVSFSLLAVGLYPDCNLAELHVGQLVKDEYFTLFEAVGALEVRHYPLSPR